jgi:S1-C subfamily serine protease
VRAVGSGVVLDAREGIVVTNNHVIDGADEITISLADSHDTPAKLIGRDPETDVAVLKIDADDLVAIPSGDSDRVQVGDFVLAIGNPFTIGQTVTSGMVSGLHRTDIGIEKYEDFIQTDAAIYPGNSGGALVNFDGELVGINTAFIGAGHTNPGVGFAIPINMIRAVAERLIKHGEIRRGELGISFENNPSESISKMQIGARSTGAMVASTAPGSAAQRAGLKAGDVVTELDGVPVRDKGQLRNRLAFVFVGQVAELTVVRDGRPFVVRVAPVDRVRTAGRPAAAAGNPP